MSAAPAGGDKKNIVKMAYIYFQEGRWDKAIEEYKKLIALDPEDINTHNMLGDVYVKKGASREAFEEYIKVSADFSSRGQSDKAAIVNKKLASLDSSLLSPEAQKKQSLIKQTIKAESAMEQGDVDMAIDALSEVLKLDSENLTAYSKLGELFEKKGKIPEAIQQFQMLGAAFLKNRLYKKALEMYQKVVALEPNNVDARINLANISIKQGSESDAKKEFLIIAELSLNAGDMEKANTYAMKAIEFKSIEAHYVLGIILFKKQQFSEARAEFESLLRFKVNHVGALVYLGKVFLELNQADKSAENIQKALKIEKDNLVALEAWVELSVKKGNKPEAIATLTTLVDRYSEKNEMPKAAEFARYITSLDENSVMAYTKLGEILKQTGDKSKAADSFFTVALLLEKQGKKDLSAEFVRKTLELNPNHSEAQKRMMGQVVVSASSISSAPPSSPTPKTAETIGKIPVSGVMDLEQEITNPPVVTAKPLAHVPGLVVEGPDEELKAQISIAENYVKQGLVEEAIEIYQQLIESYPDHPEIKQKLNQAYTAYVKTGDDIIGALEAEKRVKEDDEKRLRQEMEKKTHEAARLKAELDQKNRLEAEKKVRSELEKKAREEAEKKADEEIERLAKEGVLKKAREEAERKVREETEKKAKTELEKRVWEEMSKKEKEESERKTQEEKAHKKQTTGPSELTTSKTGLPSKGESVGDEGRDEFMTIAVADIYTRRGLYEEASKIYRYILKIEPDNLEARKKLSDLESLMKFKGSGASPPPEPPPASAQPSPGPSRPPKGPEKDSDGKKKSSRVGYV